MFSSVKSHMFHIDAYGYSRRWTIVMNALSDGRQIGQIGPVHPELQPENEKGMPKGRHGQTFV